MLPNLYITYLTVITLLIPALALTALRARIVNQDWKTLITSIVISLLNALGGAYVFITYTFFVLSSSALTRLGREVKLRLGHRDIFGRSWKQILGVGLVPGLVNLAALILYLAEARSAASRLLLTALVLYAVSSADTWSSEVGMLYRGKPRLILGLREAETGTSGAVTPLGTLASALGSLATGGVSILALNYLGSVGIPIVVRNPLLLLLLLFLLGLLGGVIDSVLGCLLQEKRKCKVCGIICEQFVHCNVETIPVRGCRHFSGEVINSLTQLIILILSLALTPLVT